MKAFSFALVALSAWLTSEASAGPAAAIQNIRPRDATAELLLQFGSERSSTFRRLVRDLERSSVIVYIDVRQEGRHPIGGGLHFLTEAQGVRWVRARVDSGTSSVGRTHQDVVRLTAILAHELRHALEAAAANMRNVWSSRFTSVRSAWTSMTRSILGMARAPRRREWPAGSAERGRLKRSKQALSESDMRRFDEDVHLERGGERDRALDGR